MWRESFPLAPAEYDLAVRYPCLVLHSGKEVLLILFYDYDRTVAALSLALAPELQNPVSKHCIPNSISSSFLCRPFFGLNLGLWATYRDG